MDIRFWGTRGSLAKPGRITLRHGGNTSCVEVRGDDATLIVEAGGTVDAFGLNSTGSAGGTVGTPRTSPELVAGLSGVIAVAAGGSTSFALKELTAADEKKILALVKKAIR